MLTTVFAFLVLLSILVFVHEFGHFRAARFFGVRVEEFGFGFPPRLFSYQGKETRYSVNWIPLGGFVKIKGEHGEAQHDPDSFASQKAWKRLCILGSGVAMNVVLGVVLFSFLFTIGIDGPIDAAGRFASVADQRIIVLDVLQHGPAEEAGILAGDTLLSVDGRAIETIGQFQEYVQEKKDQTISLVVNRGKEQKTFSLVSQYLPGAQRGGIGVFIEEQGRISYPWYIAPWKAIEVSVSILIQTVIALSLLIAQLFSAQSVTLDVSGPVGIAVMTKKIIQIGFRRFLEFSAILSLNLALVNALPIPALDGGRIFFLFLEKVRGRIINPKIENLTHVISFALLITLMVVVTYFDVLRIFSSR